MQIASIGQSIVGYRVPEAAERGPDHDRDKDDRSVAAAKSSPSEGVGSKVDLIA